MTARPRVGAAHLLACIQLRCLDKEIMTMTDTDRQSKDFPNNNNLPTSNPSLRTVLLVLAAIAAVAVTFVLFMEYGS